MTAMSSEMNFSFEDYLNEDIDTGFDSNCFDDTFVAEQSCDSGLEILHSPTGGFETVDDEALQQAGRDIEAESNLYRLELAATPGADVALDQPFTSKEPAWSVDKPGVANEIA